MNQKHHRCGSRKNRTCEAKREALLERISPYRTKHINRRGKYRLDLSRVPPEADYAFELGVESRGKGQGKPV